MRTIHITKEVKGGRISARIYSLKQWRLMTAYATENWYRKGKEDSIPIFVSDGRLYFFRFAISFYKERSD